MPAPHPVSKPERPLGSLENERILGEEDAAALLGISTDTLRRKALRDGKPRRIQLSPRRVGYKLKELLAL
jgi:hypothetical protein